jgi:N-acetylglucosamine-6-phosphate deacetylase
MNGPSEWLQPDAVFDGGALREGLAVEIVGDMIRQIAPARPDAKRISGIIAPGFVDLQVNGGGGVLLNTAPTVAGLQTIAAAHRAFGTTALLPTVITDAPEVLQAAADAVIENGGADGILGLHIEGPHIAEARRGTHAARFIRPMDNATMAVVRRLRSAGHTVMITVAPEACRSDQIAELAQTGAVVAIGHSDCDAASLRAALDAGATCGTHLFNAMSQMTGREPGIVGGLLSAGAFTGLICDGHHVADEMIRLALRAHAYPERMFLVSDAMATVGGPDRFTLYGREIALQDGRLVDAEGRLAGAHLTQGAGLARMVQRIGVGLEQALRMVIATPAEVIGRPDLASLTGRPLRDAVLIDPAMQVRALAEV